MRKDDVHLWHMVAIVVICILMCNMCKIGKDKFDMEWIEGTKSEL